MAEFLVRSSSINEEFSGSIAKILALGEAINPLVGDATGSNIVEPVLSRIEFGISPIPHSGFEPTSVIGEIQIPAGTYIDGPIGRTKVKSGSFLVYFNT